MKTPPSTFLDADAPVRERRATNRIDPSHLSRWPQGERGSVLIIVTWVCFGLVTLALYFANSMSSELRASALRVADGQARQALAGGTRYAGYLLAQLATDGAVPRLEDYRAEALPLAEGQFWFIGRNPDAPATTEPFFGLCDEGAKLNLNTADRSMLEALPGMTPELADAILAWREPNREEAAANAPYAQLDPARLNKGAAFESVDELRLVYGATLELLFGEDANRNGSLDENENDGGLSAPRDDQDGLLLAGLLEYTTIFTRQPARRLDGGPRINICTPATRTGLHALLRQRVGADRAAALVAAIGDRSFGSVAEFMWESGMTGDEYALVHTDFTHRSGTVAGLVNVNTASEVVLACIPGIEQEHAGSLVTFRLAHPEALTSFAWLKEVLPRENVVRAGPYLTDQSYQFSADVAATGGFGRGYARTRTLFDMSNGTPRIIHQQDLAAYGWALGAEARQRTRETWETGP